MTSKLHSITPVPDNEIGRRDDDEGSEGELYDAEEAITFQLTNGYQMNLPDSTRIELDHQPPEGCLPSEIDQEGALSMSDEPDEEEEVDFVASELSHNEDEGSRVMTGADYSHNEDPI